MYAGRKVEETDVARLFDAPRHPYTQGLLASVPTLDALGGDAAPERRAQFGARQVALRLFQRHAGLFELRPRHARAALGVLQRRFAGDVPGR